MSRTVEIRNAGVFTCEGCGLDTFVHMIECGPPEPDLDDDGQWMMMPDHVVCQHCGAEFDAEQLEEYDD
jgi:rubredoxin